MLRLLLELMESPSGVTGSVSVVPVVVDSYSGHNDLVRATARSIGGAVVVAADVAEGISGSILQVEKTRVETLLQVPRAGGGLSKVSVLEEDGIVRAAIDGRVDISSTSQREVAGLAAGLFSQEIHDAKTAFVVLNEDVLDDEWIYAVWRLFREVDGTKFMDLDQIVLLIERSAADTLDHHFESEPSVRFLLQTSGIMRRKSQTVNSADVRHIARRAREDGLVVFLGAGFSQSSGLPLGDTLRDDALGEFIGQPSASFSELAFTFHDYLRENERLLEVEIEMSREEFCSRLTLERILREEIWRSGAGGSPTLDRFADMNAGALDSLGPSVRKLQEIMSMIPGLVIVTVNFDTLIESNGVNVQRMVSDEDFRVGEDYLAKYVTGQQGPVPLLKLHGSIEERETIVATVDQTAQGLSTPKQKCMHAILDEGKKLPWVYVGYSMRDPDAWSVLQARDFAENVDECWVGPFADPHALAWCSRHRQFSSENPSFWQRSITLTADKFMEELLAVWPSEDH